MRSVIWWMVVIVLVAGPLVVLAIALALLLRRLGDLRAALRRLLVRVRSARDLTAGVAALRERAGALGQEVAATGDRAALARTSTGRRGAPNRATGVRLTTPDRVSETSAASQPI
ncbi:MAG: hypothetical protein QOI74_285 [Micromonosporaceae bacterium]|nr:hypothetical protein [Micromonosporaceae bacterium]